MRTNDQSKCLHRQLWEWLAKNPDMTVGQWPGWKAMIERGEGWPANMSFACEVAMRTCPICPVDWGKKGYRCFDPGSLLDEYANARQDLKSFYAWQIRDAWKR